MIERDKELQVWTDTAENALRFFGLPENDVWRVRVETGQHDDHPGQSLFAVTPPEYDDHNENGISGEL